MSELMTRVVREAARPASAVLLVGALGAACLSSSGCSSSPSSEAKGTVTCSAGESVEGVWIDAGTGQGWAQWRLKNAQNPAVAEYSRNVGGPTNYGVHVGCGGTPRNWEHADYGQQSAASDIAAVWQCGPDPSQPLAVNGICVLMGKG
jgi:hypothetical protein